MVTMAIKTRGSTLNFRNSHQEEMKPQHCTHGLTDRELLAITFKTKKDRWLRVWLSLIIFCSFVKTHSVAHFSSICHLCSFIRALVWRFQPFIATVFILYCLHVDYKTVCVYFDGLFLFTRLQGDWRCNKTLHTSLMLQKIVKYTQWSVRSRVNSNVLSN